MEQNLKISHPDENLSVLYNGNGNHDKIYAIALMKDFEGQYHIYGFYKARTAKTFRWTKVATHQGHVEARTEFVSLRLKKTQKGYVEVKTDKNLKKLGLEDFQTLAARLESLAATGSELNGETAVEGKEVELSDFECLDDFGFQGIFAIGCWYSGYWDGSSLFMLGDDGKPRKVDPDNFATVEQPTGD